MEMPRGRSGSIGGSWARTTGIHTRAAMNSAARKSADARTVLLLRIIYQIRCEYKFSWLGCCWYKPSPDERVAAAIRQPLQLRFPAACLSIQRETRCAEWQWWHR